MTSDFLHCTICPKKPDFSDVSHLLTHIGSKGHLAHLHSLQVRSHQDDTASRDLAAYNQWYNHHGLATLLSERLQQKVQKQAAKTAANHRRLAAGSGCSRTKTRKPIKQEIYPSLNLLIPAEAQISSNTVDNDNQNQEAKAEFQPDGESNSRYPVIPSSPPQTHIHLKEEEDDSVSLYSDVIDKESSETPKLKGIQWPGMNLFDAAPEDLKRKRNQKKDDSVLEKLERNAALVQPTETVETAAGMVLKHRHIDNLEDDSPVEGEEIIVEPAPQKRKSGLLRSRRQTSDSSNIQSDKPRRGRPFTPIKRSGSPVDKIPKSKLLSSVVEQEGGELSLPFRKVNRRKNKKTAFTIYEDSSPSIGVDGSKEETSSAYVDVSAVQPQTAFHPASFLRDATEPYDPFKTFREQFPSSVSSFSQLGQGKENCLVPYNGLKLGRETRVTANPLCFHGDATHGMDVDYNPDGHFNLPIAEHTNPFRVDHGYMPTRNPLMLPMYDFNESRVAPEEFGLDDTPSRHPRLLFAP